MVETVGNYEVDVNKGEVWLTDQAIVNSELFGEYDRRVAKLFLYAFEKGRSSAKRELWAALDV